MTGYIKPVIEQVSSQITDLASLRADDEQQQQQQQQQQGSNIVRRYLNAENYPEEEVTTKLTTQITAVNRLASRKS